MENILYTLGKREYNHEVVQLVLKLATYFLFLPDRKGFILNKLQDKPITREVDASELLIFDVATSNAKRRHMIGKSIIEAITDSSLTFIMKGDSSDWYVDDIRCKDSTRYYAQNLLAALRLLIIKDPLFWSASSIPGVKIEIFEEDERDCGIIKFYRNQVEHYTLW